MTSALPRLRAIWARGPWRSSILDAVAVLALGLLALAFDFGGLNGWEEVDPRWLHVLPLVGGCAAIAVKRQLPRTALVAGCLLFGVDFALGGSLGMLLVVSDLLYATVSFDRRNGLRFAIIVAAVGALLLATTVSSRHPEVSALAIVLQYGAIATIPLWWATNVRQRDEIAEYARRELQVERSRNEDAARLADAERERQLRALRSTMAAELHDGIASRLSAIAINASAARDERDAADPTLTSIRAEAVAALEDMRAMITLLRRSTADAAGDEVGIETLLAAPPLLEDIVAAAEQTGLTVDARVATATDDLPESIGYAIARITQEAVANARRHAPGEALEIELSRTSATGGSSREDVVLVYRNGRSDAAPDTSGTGTGLWAIRERAAALGGSVAVEDTAERWELTVTLPLTRSAVTA